MPDPLKSSPSPCGRGLGRRGNRWSTAAPPPSPLPQGEWEEVVVVGIGNPDRGDDAVGRLIARSLRTRVPANVRVVEHDGEATALLADLQSARCVWLIDAAQSGARAGHDPPHRLFAIDLPLPPGTRLVARLRCRRGDRACPCPRCAAAALRRLCDRSDRLRARRGSVTAGRRGLRRSHPEDPGELVHSAGEGTTLGANRKVFCTGFGGN